MTDLPLVPDALLAILRCPHTGSVLQRAPASWIASVNQQIAAAQLRNRAGELLTQTWHEGLLNADQTILYPVYEHGATLIYEESLETSLFADNKRAAEKT